MSSRSGAASAVRAKPRKGRDDGAMKRFWKRFRKPLARSRFAKGAIASVLAQALRFVHLTNPLAKGSSDFEAVLEESGPLILALWHGQHLLAPCARPRGQRVMAMVSRSADAEINALVLQKLGFEAARGSGGRDTGNHRKKGGARALIALKKSLDEGNHVAMIADIPHGTPRQSGLGIVTLARISGRPILPVALTTSRRKVIEKSWDKTTINLPFGRMAVMVGEPLFVADNADEHEMEAKRKELTDALNAATEQAIRLADGGK
jgi:lysophospholipid acyltransferase (LPLAT)-like uncharacterized protein